MNKIIVIASFLILALAITAMAQAPDSFVYQGRLTDTEGNPIVTTTAVTFRLYSALTGGSLLHSWNSVSVAPDNNGVFTAELTAMDRNDFVNGNKLYMQIEIGGQILAPRQLLTSVPYAYSAQYAESLPNNSVTSANIVDEPGIAYEINNGSVALVTAEMTDIAVISITVPAAGYIDVEGTCFVMFSGTTGANQAIFQIDQTAGGTYTMHEARAGFDAYTVSTDNVFPVYVTRLYSVAAGTYTFRLEGLAQNGSPAVATVWYGKVKATYFPKNYGTVDLAPENNNDNPDQTLNSIIDPNTGMTVESMQTGTQGK